MEPTILFTETTTGANCSHTAKQYDALVVGLLEGLIRALECFSSTLDIIENSI